MSREDLVSAILMQNDRIILAQKLYFAVVTYLDAPSSSKEADDALLAMNEACRAYERTKK